jgi:hypothetical protein
MKHLLPVCGDQVVPEADKDGEVRRICLERVKQSPQRATVQLSWNAATTWQGTGKRLLGRTFMQRLTIAAFLGRGKSPELSISRDSAGAEQLSPLWHH